MAEKKYANRLKNAGHERFCQEYILDSNATGSYRIAYPKVTTKTAEVSGCNLLRNPRVKGRLAYLQSQLAKRAEKTADDVIRELEKIGFSNIHDYIDKDNAIKDLSGIPRDKAAAVESVEVTEDKKGKKVKFKLYDKKSALVDLGRRHGIFRKDNEQSRVILHTPGLQCKK